jgi:hypothetical protein
MKCHLCHWSRDTTQKKPILQDSTPLRVTIPEVTQDDTPSVGSIGHPFSCNIACKYYFKKHGCKDGRLCERCHLCRWSRCCEKANANGEGKFKNRSAPECTQKMHDGTELRVDGIPATKLPSPRCAEILSSNIKREMPMYIRIHGATSF